MGMRGGERVCKGCNLMFTPFYSHSALVNAATVAEWSTLFAKASVIVSWYRSWCVVAASPSM